MSKQQPRIMIMGPVPPPFGGIASIISFLTETHFEDLTVQVFETTIRNSTPAGRLLHGGRMIGRLIAALLKYRPDGLVCFSGAYTSFWEKAIWSALARLFGGRTALIMVDGNFPTFEMHLGPIRRWVMQRILQRSNVVGVQSKGWLEYYRTLCPSGKYSIVVGGVDPNVFSPLPSKAENQHFQILFVGWLIEAKGIYDLLTAATIMKRGGLRFQIRLVGPLFDEGARFRREIKGAALEDCINILGPVLKTEDLVAEYRASDLFVLPSYAEGFPNSILEAMAVGLPVVATAVGGSQEIIDSGICGLLVPPRDAVQLAAALSKIHNDPQSRQSMGEAARSKLLTHYTLDHALASYQSLFRYLLPAKKRYGANQQALPEDFGQSGID